MSLFGFARLDITPEPGCLLYGYVDDLVSESIHDRLNINAFYFENADSNALMLSAEVCSVNTAVSARIRKEISKKLDICYDNIILHGIHNHTGPNTDGNCGWGDLDIDYCEHILLPAALKASERARETAVPAKAGFAIGQSLIGVNRREQTLENTVTFGQCPWGPFDPRMAIIAFRDLNDKPIANLIFYTCHGTCAGKCTAISRDWAGGMIDMLSLHSNAPSAFFCGAEGDVGPRLPNGQTVGNISDAEEMGKLAGKDAVRIFDSINAFSPLDFSVIAGDIRIPLKPRISKEDAIERLLSVRNKTVNIDGQIRNYCERVLSSYDMGFSDESFYIFRQTVLSIGSFIFACFPYELFSEIALRIDKAVKNKNIFCLSNANGSEGYFPSNSEISKGGYEIDMYLTHNIQPYCDNADFHLIKETLKNLEDLLCTE